ncbi:MAG: hypothetical protein DMG00_13235 [Acidobacteria bacterium]|nr:MAG: hypothetical protein DMG00_13235 [Acidobacteriota bacterium]
MTRRRGSVLLVDDEDKLRKSLGRALRGDGHEVVDAEDARLALRLLGERVFDVLLVDNMMPGMTGLDLIREIVATRETGAPGVVDPQPQIVMMTAHATVESAIEAMKLGAIDYLQKPFEIDELLVTIRRALDHQRLRTDYSYLRSERDEQFDHYGIVGCSHAMQGVIARIELVARTKSTILITGETGTGKELVARAIHDRSAQREMPLVKVNCAAIPETVLESELFGHVRGAFTDAIATKKGKFALADGGTILLDEIGVMTPALQSKLLRVLQEREFEPVGAERPESVDVRVIAATNRDLRQMVADGRFQSDLFYLLNVIPTSNRSCIISCKSTRSARGAASPASIPPRSPRSGCMTGRATCASWRTRSNARSCCRPDRLSPPRRCRWPRRRYRVRLDCRRSCCAVTSNGWSATRFAWPWIERAASGRTRPR